jgi:hypothetical protein
MLSMRLGCPKEQDCHAEVPITHLIAVRVKVVVALVS